MYLSKALCLIYECEQMKMFTQPDSLVAHLFVNSGPLKFKHIHEAEMRSLFVKAEEAVEKNNLQPVHMLGNRCGN